MLLRATLTDWPVVPDFIFVSTEDSELQQNYVSSASCHRASYAFMLQRALCFNIFTASLTFGINIMLIFRGKDIDRRNLKAIKTWVGR